MNQARRLGKSFSSVQISKIYASDLKRAHWTALQIATQNASLLSALSPASTTASIREPEGSSRKATLVTEGTNNLEGETEEEIVETEPGPSSYMSTDREGAASFDPMSGGTVPSTGSGSTAGSSYANAVGSSEYEDDFSCSSSAAASSPIRGSTASSSTPASIQQPRTSASSASSSSTHGNEERLAQTVTTTPLLREQFFGLAEGQNWKTGYATSSSSFHNRSYKFEGGESLQDVHARAEEIMQRCVLPWLVRATMGKKKEHVVLVAHGIVSAGMGLVPSWSI